MRQIADSAHDDEFSFEPFLLGGEFCGHAAAVEHFGWFSALPVNEHLSRRKPLFREFVCVHGTVFDGQNAHRDTVKEFVFSVSDGVVSALYGDEPVHDTAREERAG